MAFYNFYHYISLLSIVLMADTHSDLRCVISIDLQWSLAKKNRPVICDTIYLECGNEHIIYNIEQTFSERG